MNEKAYESMKSFGKVVLKYLEQNCHERHSTQYMPYTLFLEHGKYQHTFKRKIIDTDTVIKNHTENIFNIPETKETINTLLAENIFHCLAQLDDSPFYRDMYLFFTEDLIRFLTDYIERTANFYFNESEFKKLYLKYEKGWPTDTLKLRAIVPLLDFDSNVNKIELPNNAVLECFDNEEKAELWNSHKLDSIFNINDFVECKYKIKCYYDLGYKPADDIKKSRENIEKIITAMRLTHNGHFGSFGFIESAKDPRNAHYRPSRISFMDNYNLPAYVDRKVKASTDGYYFNSKNLEKFQEIFGNLKSENKLSIAILKFNQAYSRILAEDAIIDLTISLESSILFGTKDELKYRLAVRGATLLKDLRDSEETYNTLKFLYDIRSKIVHNGNYIFKLIKDEKIGKIDKNEFMPLNFQIVREILTEYLKHLNSGVGMEKINMKLDKQMIKSLVSNSE
jgi:hypothetical protein